MIDTVRRHVYGEWKGTQPSSWERRESEVVTDGNQGKRLTKSVFFTHRPSGLRVWGDQNKALMLEASLPRQVYPGNGMLLTSQEDVERAYSSAVRRMGDVVDVESLGGYTRVDTVWQFKGEPSAWVRNLATVRWPYTRKAPRSFFEESVDWMGTRVGLRVYDKSREQTGRPGDVVRVELQTCARALRDTREKRADLPINFLMSLGGGWRKGSGLPVELLYPWYRSHVTKLPVFTVAPCGERLDIYSFLGALEVAECEINGVGAVDFWLDGRSLRTQRRTRSMIAGRRLQDVLLIDLESMLPEKGLPEPVHFVAA